MNNKILFSGFVIIFTSLIIGSCVSSNEEENEILKFTDPILESISGINPDYENDFTVEKSGLEEGGNAGGEYSGGEYRFRVTATADWAMSYTSDIFYNLVLKTKLRYLTGTENGDFFIKLQGSNDPFSTEGYHIHFKGDNNIYLFGSSDGSNDTQMIASKEIDLMHEDMNFINITIIAKDSKVAILIDSDPILLVEDNEYRPQFRDGPISFELNNGGTSDSVEVYIDDLEVWDISNLDNELNLKEIKIQEMSSPEIGISTKPCCNEHFHTFTAQSVYSDDSTSDYTSDYNWVSSDISIGTIDASSGVFELESEGLTYISADKDDVTSDIVRIYSESVCDAFIVYGTAEIGSCFCNYRNGFLSGVNCGYK
jgi:hypothetical protein